MVVSNYSDSRIVRDLVAKVNCHDCGVFVITIYSAERKYDVINIYSAERKYDVINVYTLRKGSMIVGWLAWVCL